jgi:hypothetical protein
VRFRPTDPVSVLGWAEKEFRRTDFYRLSVFADAPRGDEPRASVIGRLVEAAALSGIDPAKNRRVFVCASAGDLLDLNFLFYKDDEDDEVPEHYSIDLGPSPDEAVVRRFLEPFRLMEEDER